MKSWPTLGFALLLSACNVSFEHEDEEDAAASAGQNEAQPRPTPETASLAFQPAPNAGTLRGADNPVLHAQVVLDRLGFSPGVIDGKEGQSFTLALKGFQAANDLEESGTLDDPTRKALERWRGEPAVQAVVIPAAFARGPFTPKIPEDVADQAKLPALNYRGLMEALAERFHTDAQTLIALNSPSTKVGAGTTVVVPAIPDAGSMSGVDDERGWATTLQRLGVGAGQPKAARIVVDKSEGSLRVFDGADKLVAQFPATMGSVHDPLPIGNWKINGVSRNPDFRYNPDLFWDADAKDDKALLKPGPNGPVGVVWIDLSKPHYGIHGTSEPESIGRAQSHGCVRLTNWDAARLAQMVSGETAVVFQE